MKSLVGEGQMTIEAKSFQLRVNFLFTPFLPFVIIAEAGALVPYSLL